MRRQAAKDALVAEMKALFQTGVSQKGVKSRLRGCSHDGFCDSASRIMVTTFVWLVWLTRLFHRRQCGKMCIGNPEGFRKASFTGVAVVSMSKGKFHGAFATPKFSGLSVK